MAVQPAATRSLAEEEIALAKKHGRWAIIATLSVLMFFVIGAAGSSLPIFLEPLIKLYGWSHARVSTLPTVYLLLLGLGAPVAGWLLDRLEARAVMASGPVVVALGFLAASQVHSYWPMVGAFVLIGAGAASSAFVPTSMVAANWFADNRGLAVGSTLSASAAGGILLPPMTDYLIRNFSVGAAFVALAVPIAVIVVPLVIFVVRTRPAGATKTSVAEEVRNLPGLDLGPAVRTAPFWLLACVQISASASLGATFYHMVPFFIHSGYSPQHAALLLAATTAVGFPGNLAVGLLVDRFTARRVLPCVVTTLGVSPLLLLGSGHLQGWLAFLVPFAILFGISVNVTTAVMPVAVVETLGLKRFGSISGLLGLAATVGLCGGVMLVGCAFDRTASYSIAFDLSAACAFLGVIAAFSVSRAECINEAVPA